VAECREGLGESTFESWMKKAASPNQPLKWIQENFVLGGSQGSSNLQSFKKGESIPCFKF